MKSLRETRAERIPANSPSKGGRFWQSSSRRGTNTESADRVLSRGLIRIHGSPFDEAGLEALGADSDLEEFAVACIDSDGLKVDVPASACVSVGMTHCVSCHRTAPAALAKFSHDDKSSVVL